MYICISYFLLYINIFIYAYFIFIHAYMCVCTNFVGRGRIISHLTDGDTEVHKKEGSFFGHTPAK